MRVKRTAAIGAVLTVAMAASAATEFATNAAPAGEHRHDGGRLAKLEESTGG
jgi:hypothetical protein